MVVEVSAVRTEAGSVKSIEEGSPLDGKALRMVDMMMFTVLGVLMGPSVASWARPGSGSAGAVEDNRLAGGNDYGSLKKYCTMDGGVSTRAELKVAGETVA